jgi:hypothetical protein
MATVAFFSAPSTAQTLSNFEGYSNGTQVMFQQPNFSGTTFGFLDSSPNVSFVTNAFPNGNPNAGQNVYFSSWSFSNPMATNAWLRYVTSGAANVPNPVISFSQGLSFDMYSDHALYVALSLRETNPSGSVGSNGGTSGNLEFVGGTTDNTGTPVKGHLLAANTWTTLFFDIPNEPVRAFTGNGVLESSTGKGVLDSLVIVPLNTSQTGTYRIFTDNFLVVPEPSSLALELLCGLSLWKSKKRLLRMRR